MQARVCVTSLCGKAGQERLMHCFDRISPEPTLPLTDSPIVMQFRHTHASSDLF